MAPRREKARILNEFVEVTGYHRKHAIRVLLNTRSEPVPRVARNRVYDAAVRQVLIVLWEAADRLCGKRLKALMPMLLDSMQRHGHLSLDCTVKAKLLSISAAH